MYCGDDVEAVVGDVGARVSKFGLAGEDTPKVVVASVVGRSQGEAAEDQRICIVGETRIHARPTELTRPTAGGVVRDWDALEALWNHAYANLRVEAAEHPVIVSTPACWASDALAAAAARDPQRYMEMLFEKFDVPCCFLAKDAMVDAFAFGRSSAMIVEVGASATRVVPVYDGYPLQRPAQCSRIGGDAMSTYLASLVRQQHPNLQVYPRCCFTRKVNGNGKLETTLLPADTLQTTIPQSYLAYMRSEVFRDMREVVATTSATPLQGPLAQAQVQGQSPTPPQALEEMRYELPDGHVLQLGRERYQVVEYLLHPEVAAADMNKTKTDTDTDVSMEPTEPASTSATPGISELTPKGLPQMLYDAVQACDADLRREMLSNIILCGGGSLTHGLTERLHADLTAMVPSSFKVRFLTAPKIERQFSCFIGQSILASLGSFQQMWVSRREYDEVGAEKLCADRFL